MQTVAPPPIEAIELLAQAEAVLCHDPIEAGRLLTACLGAVTTDAPTSARATVPSSRELRSSRVVRIVRLN